MSNRWIVGMVGSVLLAGGCSSSPAAKDVTAASAAGAASEAPSAGDKLPTDKLSTDKCSPILAEMASLNVNWQLATQLRDKADVTEWSHLPIGTLDKMGEQVAALRVLEPYGADVKPTLDLIQSAGDIIAKGRGGDTAAPAALKALLPGELTSVLLKMAPLGQSLSEAGC
jgi:hypothetical protein